jgi:hypothetical protein
MTLVYFFVENIPEFSLKSLVRFKTNLDEIVFVLFPFKDVKHPSRMAALTKKHIKKFFKWPKLPHIKVTCKPYLLT